MPTLASLQLERVPLTWLTDDDGAGVAECNGLQKLWRDGRGLVGSLHPRILSYNARVDGDIKFPTLDRL